MEMGRDEIAKEEYDRVELTRVDKGSFGREV